MKSNALPARHLELRVRELGQLFNSMDPTPFLNKDLDREAEAFIETWATNSIRSAARVARRASAATTRRSRR